MIPLAALSMLLAVGCCVHAVRTGRDTYWIYLILIIQPLGAVIYLVSIVLPEFMSGKGRQLGRKAVATLDPTRAYREARALVEDAPSVYNRMQLAEAATELGQFEEAAHIYALCLDGVHASDLALMLRYANCLVELGRFTEALAILDRISASGTEGRSPQAALLTARTREGLGDAAAAEPFYEWAARQGAGLEGIARYVAFLMAQGRAGEAAMVMETLEKRWSKIPRAFRKQEGQWRKFAAEAMQPPAQSPG